MKFSILTTCRNKRPFVSDCYRSIMAQTFRDWEWIIVDDCSTDGSFKALLRLQRPNNIKIISARERLFCGGAYELALKSVTGDIVGVVDMDDALYPSALSEVYALYQKYPDIDYIYTQHEVCNKELKKFRNGVSSLPVLGKSLAEMAVDKKHCYSHWRTFRSSIVPNATRPLFKTGMRCCVDKNLGMVLEESGHGGFYNKVLYKYRWYMGNLTSISEGGSNKKRWMKLARQYRERREVNKTTTYPVVEVTL